MQAERTTTTRRFTLLDAIIVVGATAIAILPATELWPEVVPVAQRLEVTRLFESGYAKEELFGGHMRSGRMATVRIQMAQLVNMALGLPSSRDTYVNNKTRKPAPQEWVQNLVETHAPPGALGFALAQDAFWLFFPPLLVASFCLICLRLVPPRPSWATLFRQPGWWACLASVLGVMLGYSEGILFENPVPSVIVPGTVTVVWLALVVSRLWRAERSWIDRAGRLLGILWIATIPLYLVGFVWS